MIQSSPKSASKMVQPLPKSASNMVRPMSHETITRNYMTPTKNSAQKVASPRVKPSSGKSKRVSQKVMQPVVDSDAKAAEESTRKTSLASNILSPEAVVAPEGSTQKCSNEAQITDHSLEASSSDNSSCATATEDLWAQHHTFNILSQDIRKTMHKQSMLHKQRKMFGLQTVLMSGICARLEAAGIAVPTHAPLAQSPAAACPSRLGSSRNSTNPFGLNGWACSPPANPFGMNGWAFSPRRKDHPSRVEDNQSSPVQQLQNAETNSAFESPSQCLMNGLVEDAEFLPGFTASPLMAAKIGALSPAAFVGSPLIAAKIGAMSPAASPILRSLITPMSPLHAVSSPAVNTRLCDDLNDCMSPLRTSVVA